MRNLEIECKLDANTPRAFWRARQFLKKLNPQLAPENLCIQDNYLDDSARNLAARKIALRVRNTDGRWETTFKTRTEIKNGKAVRREETLPLPQVRNLAQALETLNQKKKWKSIKLTGLTVQFSILNKRTVFSMDYEGASLEIALDDFKICAQRKQLKKKEIEIELKQGNAQQLDRFVKIFKQQTLLQTAKISKVKTAEKFLNSLKKRICQAK